MALNVGEKGVVFRIGVAYDMSSNTKLSLTFTKPTATDTLVVTSTGTPAVALGTTLATTEFGNFNANEWASYTFASGDVDEAGTWRARLTYEDAAKLLISETATFTVAT